MEGIEALADPSGSHELFELIVEQSAAVYGATWPGCALQVSRSADHPRLDGHGGEEYPMLATTRAGTGSAVVELRVFPDAFGPSAFAAVPALLVRECICHVPADPPDARPDGTTGDESDGGFDRGLFREGFLDWAAEFFLNRWAGLLEPELSGPARQHGMVILLLDRMGPTPRCQSRRVGRRSAEELSGWLRDSGRLSTEEAAVHVARLAVELNMDDSPPEYKDLAVSRLRLRPYPADVGGALVDWIENRCPVADFLQTVGGDGSAVASRSRTPR